MKDFWDELAGLRRRLSEAERDLDLVGKRERLAKLEEQAADPELWDDPDKARAVTTEMARARDDVELLGRMAGQLSDAEVLFGLARDEGDDSLEPELAAAVEGLDRELAALEL